MNLLEDREKISKIGDSPLKNQADGQPTNGHPDVKKNDQLIADLRDRRQMKMQVDR